MGAWPRARIILLSGLGVHGHVIILVNVFPCSSPGLLSVSGAAPYLPTFIMGTSTVVSGDVAVQGICLLNRRSGNFPNKAVGRQIRLF